MGKAKGKNRASKFNLLAELSGSKQKKAHVDDITLLEHCNDILELLDNSESKEKYIALAIVAKYGHQAVAGEPMTHYHYVDAAIRAKRNEHCGESLSYYNQFFRESIVGKAWFMTYYGVAKTLAVAGDYSRALTAIGLAIELASLTKCADAEYIYQRHYLSIRSLKQGKILHQYIDEIQG